MRKLLFLFLLLPCPALADQIFKYKENCYLETDTHYLQDVCTIVDTREKDGSLKTRNIYSNRFSLTIKGRFDPVQGYLTYDSYNKFTYKWNYKVGGLNMTSYVMPNFLVENISWD